MFKGAKREVKKLNEEFKTRCVVASSDNAWIDEPLTEQFCHKILRICSFRCRIWDAFSCHLTHAMNGILNQGKVDSVIVPGGCTKYIQAADVSWNKPMKEYLREMYDLWLAENEHELTTHGHMKPVPSLRTFF